MLRAASATDQKQGKREQEEADRPVDAGEPQIGQERRRREAVDRDSPARRRRRCSLCLGQQDVACLRSLLALRSELDEASAPCPPSFSGCSSSPACAPAPRSSLSPHRRTISATCSDCKPGDEILLFNGKDGEWRAELGAIGQEDAQASRVAQQTAPARPGARSALSVRAAEARPPRLHGAEGDRAGRERCSGR